MLLAADGALLAEAGNTAPTTGDPSGHAELNALRDAVARRGAAALKGATLYASTEPCPMCATAAHLGGIGRVVFGMRASELTRARGGPLPWPPVAASRRRRWRRAAAAAWRWRARAWRMKPPRPMRGSAAPATLDPFRPDRV